MTSPASDVTASLEEALAHESRRLEKLWSAYKAQELEVRAARERADALEAALREREEALAARDDILAERDAALARAEAEAEALRGEIRALEGLKEDVKAVDAYRARVGELEAAHARERERLAKLYLVFEEQEAELARLRGSPPA